VKLAVSNVLLYCSTASSEQWTAVLLQWLAVSSGLLAVVSSEQWTAVLLTVVRSEQ